MGKKGGNWLNKQRSDKYYVKSKREGHRARSYYKIAQIDQKYNIFKVNGRYPKKILDLGAAPGAWLEYTNRKFLERPPDQQTKKFKVIGIDLTSIKPFEDAPNITTYRLDIFKPRCEEVITENAPFDIILSDLAPKTSGDFRDIAIQESMVEKIFYFLKYLRFHGNVVIKVFQSEEINRLFKLFLPHFRNFKRMKPKSSRESSREIFFVGKDFQGLD
ncbi:MAG: SAM-dependent methyltransferase [Promethearchaeota archaeon]